MKTLTVHVAAALLVAVASRGALAAAQTPDQSDGDASIEAAGVATTPEPAAPGTPAPQAGEGSDGKVPDRSDDDASIEAAGVATTPEPAAPGTPAPQAGEGNDGKVPSQAAGEQSTEAAATPTGSAQQHRSYGTTVVGSRGVEPTLGRHRSRTEVTRADIDRRLPRSAPDALLYEPGVFVQQTAHGQGAVYVRGLTGQQTVLLFDGIRLNNSTYRQGPNQYFFTLDSQSIASIQVVRGGASTRYGSDAIGGVIQALPIEAELRSGAEGPWMAFEPHLRLRGATADKEWGGRVHARASWGERVAFVGGIGGRRAGLLESGGRLLGPNKVMPSVPVRFKADGRTQRGTGFKELTADGRLLWVPAANHQLKLAFYLYRQFDTPRTDQCPPAGAPWSECLKYDEQFRTLAYGVWEGNPGFGVLKSHRATLSWQRQHERRSLPRPISHVLHVGRDIVDTFGATVAARTTRWTLADWLRVRLDYGLDLYHDEIASEDAITFSDNETTLAKSRGQYLDGSRYTYAGAYVEGSARLSEAWKLRAGGRWSWQQARAPADGESGTRAVRQQWSPWVGNVGVEWKATRWLGLLANVDRSFRAPNLDDMTSRQQTGPGFQFENPDLRAEAANSYEVGARLRTRRLIADAWVFYTRLRDRITRVPRTDDACPPQTPQCSNSWTRLQLINAPGSSRIRGTEMSLLAMLPHRLRVRLTAAWALGEGPDAANGFVGTAPLSRIPPLNGTAELSWSHRSGLSASAALRWATLQDRLESQDEQDARIPKGGTPGFAVFDVRLSYRLDRFLLVSLAAENLGDAAYRYHGSSVNGPGRGLSLVIDVGPLWR